MQWCSQRGAVGLAQFCRRQPGPSSEPSGQLVMWLHTRLGSTHSSLLHWNSWDAHLERPPKVHTHTRRGGSGDGTHNRRRGRSHGGASQLRVAARRACACARGTLTSFLVAAVATVHPSFTPPAGGDTLLPGGARPLVLPTLQRRDLAVLETGRGLVRNITSR